MMPITVVSGCPASGKTTLCDLWASKMANGVHLRIDQFCEALSHPLQETASLARGQDLVVTRAACRAAAVYAEAGYAVLVDGVLRPDLLPVVREELGGLACPVHYVVLSCDLDEVLSRNRQRRDRLPEMFIRMFHARSEVIGPYEPHRMDTGGGTPDDVLATLRSRWERGDFVLQPEPVAGE